MASATYFPCWTEIVVIRFIRVKGDLMIRNNVVFHSAFMRRDLMFDYCFFVSDPELLAQTNCQVVGRSYIYLSHLLELEKCLPIETLFPDSVSQVTTPLKLDKWTLELSTHPDRLFVEYILHGIKCGF